MPAANSSLAYRGLILLGLMVFLVVGIWLFLFRTNTVEPPTYTMRPEICVALVAIPQAGFPSAIPWGALTSLSDTLPSPLGWEIRYQATEALARRGSKELPLDTLGEMLDEERQMRNFRFALKDGRIAIDEANARRMLLNALRAFVEWHQHDVAVTAVGKDNLELQKVYRAIEKLAENSNEVVRLEAEKSRKAIGRK